MLRNLFSDGLTDNFKANLVLTPLALTIHYLILSFLGEGFNPKIVAIFIAIYIYSSRFYQPDLDHRCNRPGKAHFPFGKKISVWLLGYRGFFEYLTKSLSVLQRIIAKGWYLIWAPLSRIVTHRGATHIPIFGTYLRSAYLLLWIKIIIVAHFEIYSFVSELMGDFPTIKDFILYTLSIPANYILSPLYLFLKGMIFHYGLDRYFATYCLPVYIADSIHQLVDFYDSAKRKRAYCSTPREEWGLVKRLLPFLPF